MCMVLLLSCLLFAGGQKENQQTGMTGNKNIIVAMATDIGGLGDKSFNDGCYAGLQRAEKELGVQIRMVESKQQTDYVPNLTGLAEDGAKLVFGVGFLMADALLETARNNPQTYFGGIDIGIDPATAPVNVQGILFREQEAGYLVGIVAGYLTKKHAGVSPRLNSQNVVGAVLGMDIPPCERYQAGFYAGVKSVNPDCKVLSIVSGVFTDPAKGKEATIALIEQGADIVFQIAGLTGLGVINAAKENNILAIGVDVDQNYLAPEAVVTSALKEVSQAAFLTAKAVAEGNFTKGNREFTIKDDGVGIAPFHSFETIIPAEIKTAIAKAIENLKKGTVVPPASRKEAGYME